MTSPNDADSLLIAYVYGELSDDAARAFEERLQQDPDLRAEVDGLVATRDLLDADLEYGIESGLDEPPPHLHDAILKAEALARPVALRDAVVAHDEAARAAPQAPWVQRLSMWLLGGGAAVGVAAALVLMVSTQSETLSSPSAMAPESVSESIASADRGASADEAKAAGAKDARGARDGKNEQLRAKRRAAADPRFRSADADGMEQGAAPASPPADAPAGAASGFADREGTDKLAKAKEVELPEAEESPMEFDLEVPGAIVASSGDDDAMEEKRAFGGERAERKPARLALQPKADAAGKGFAKKKQKRAPSVASPAQSAPSAMPSKPSKKPASKASLGRSANAVCDPVLDVGCDEVLRAQEAKPKKARTSSRARKSRGKTRIAKERQLEEIEKSKAEMNAEVELLSAHRALQTGSPGRAYDLFKQAARLDRKGNLGLAPVIGQMKALRAMGAHKDALKLYAKHKRKPLKRNGMDEVTLLAAQSAESIGRTSQARALYGKLVRANKRKAEATAGLQRLDAAKANAEPALDAAAEEAR